MERAGFSLCTECEHCPELVIDESGVTIGEEGNLVRLTHAEWRELAKLVRSGTLPNPG